MHIFPCRLMKAFYKIAENFHKGKRKAFMTVYESVHFYVWETRGKAGKSRKNARIIWKFAANFVTLRRRRISTTLQKKR